MRIAIVWPFPVTFNPSAPYALRISGTMYGGALSITVAGAAACRWPASPSARWRTVQRGAVAIVGHAHPALLASLAERLQTDDGVHTGGDVTGQARGILGRGVGDPVLGDTHHVYGKALLDLLY